MFRSLSFLGVIYTLGILGLLGLIGKNVYSYYQSNDGNMLAFLDTKIEMPFAKERSKIGMADLEGKDLDSKNSDNVNVSPAGSNSETSSSSGVNSGSSQSGNAGNSSMASSSSSSSNSQGSSGAKALQVKNTSGQTASAKKQPQKARNENTDFVSLLRQNDNDGAYLVLAGSFSLTSNAIDRVQTLQKAGYKNAQIMRFDNSVLETVIAGRYSNSKTADELADMISNSLGYSAYVHKQIY